MLSYMLVTIKSGSSFKVWTDGLSLLIPDVMDTLLLPTEVSGANTEDLLIDTEDLLELDDSRDRGISEVLP